MNYLGYAHQNWLKAVNRPAYIEYASGDPYAEVDKEHFLNVGHLIKVLWERKYQSKVPDALVIAGWYHDFDRIFPAQKIETQGVPLGEYESTKFLHSQNCANLFEEYNPQLPGKLISDVKYLIERHEFGGIKKNGEYEDRIDQFTGAYNLNLAADLLCESDGLSFFEVIIYSYLKWADSDRVDNKVRFSYNKLSPAGKELLGEMEFRDSEVKTLVKKIVLLKIL